MGQQAFPRWGNGLFGAPWWSCPGSGALLSRVKVLGIGWDRIPLPKETLDPRLPQSRLLEKPCCDRGVRILCGPDLMFSSVSLIIQTFLSALEMRGCGPSRVGFLNQDTNQDTAPPQPFQPNVKRF